MHKPTMIDTSQPDITHIKPSKKANLFDLKEIWAYRSLLWQMTSRSVQTRIFQSRLTIIWGFTRPAIMTAAFFYIRQMANADFGANIPYVLFIFSGLCIWFLFAETAIQVANSIKVDAGLSRKVYFPKVLSPLSKVFERVIDIFVILFAIVAYQLILSVPVDWNVFYIVPIMLTMLILSLGTGMFFAALIIAHEDNKRILETVMYLGLFLSPVLFSKDILPAIIQKYYNANPMVGVLTNMRGSLFAPEAMDFVSWGISILIAIGLCIVSSFMLSRSLRANEDDI